MVFYGNDGEAELVFGNTEAGTFTVRLNDTSITFTADFDFTLVNKTKGADCEPQRRAEGDTLYLKYNGFDYAVKLEKGRLKDEKTIVSEKGTVKMVLNMKV